VDKSGGRCRDCRHRPGANDYGGDTRPEHGKFPIDDPVESYNLFSHLSIEMVLFLMALSRDRKKQRVISHYLTELRHMRTILKGDDLQKMGIQPGPVYSKILSELLEAKLKGHLKTREDEEKFVGSFGQA
jgi:tRNA nucleotidyltransferase (CCA-adding enzyme)